MIIKYTEQVMHDATAHHTLTDAQPVVLLSSLNTEHDIISYGTPFGQYGSAALAVPPLPLWQGSIS